jgi:hypothetical protein
MVHDEHLPGCFWRDMKQWTTYRTKLANVSYIACNLHGVRRHGGALQKLYVVLLIWEARFILTVLI